MDQALDWINSRPWDGVKRIDKIFTAKKILRIFPRRTSYTPNDDMVIINEPPGLFVPEHDAADRRTVGDV